MKYKSELIEELKNFYHEDYLITSTEQADSLLGVMKLMNVIDKIG